MFQEQDLVWDEDIMSFVPEVVTWLMAMMLAGLAASFSANVAAVVMATIAGLATMSLAIVISTRLMARVPMISAALTATWFIAMLLFLITYLYTRDIPELIYARFIY